MTDGGALWFPDLTQSDPTYALPVLCSLVFLATVETGTADGMEGQNKLTLSRMKTFMRVLAVGMVPLTAQMPVVSCPPLLPPACPPPHSLTHNPLVTKCRSPLNCLVMRSGASMLFQRCLRLVVVLVARVARGRHLFVHCYWTPEGCAALEFA